jgi:hypothetical protein
VDYEPECDHLRLETLPDLRGFAAADDLVGKTAPAVPSHSGNGHGMPAMALASSWSRLSARVAIPGAKMIPLCELHIGQQFVGAPIALVLGTSLALQIGRIA